MAKEIVKHKKLNSSFRIFWKKNKRLLIEALVLLISTGVVSLSGAVIGACISISSPAMILVAVMTAICTTTIVAVLVGGTISGPFAIAAALIGGSSPLLIIVFCLSGVIGAGIFLGIGTGIGAGIGLGVGGLLGIFVVGLERLLVGGTWSRVFGTGLNMLIGGTVGALLGAFIGNTLLPGFGIPIGGFVGSLVGSGWLLAASLFAVTSLKWIGLEMKKNKDELLVPQQFAEDDIKFNTIYSNGHFERCQDENQEIDEKNVNNNQLFTNNSENTNQVDSIKKYLNDGISLVL